jgi:hypothetical protein
VRLTRESLDPGGSPREGHYALPKRQCSSGSVEHAAVLQNWKLCQRQRRPSPT